MASGYLERLSGRLTPVERRAVLTDIQGDSAIPTPIRDRAEMLLDSRDASGEDLRELVDHLRLVQRAERTLPKTGEATNQQVKEIKRNPLFRDPGIQEDSNWLSQAFSRVGQLFQFRPPRDRPSLPAPPSGLDRALIAIAWGLLGALVLAFLVFAIRRFRWKRNLVRRARAVLEEDEPERSRDEWLEQADLLASQGRYREAVRALYLACLLEFDDRRVARFDRGETNWEHLARITASPRRPVNLDFRPPTEAFDRVWYGFQVEGQADVTRFREWYQEVKSRLSEVAA